MELDRKPGHWCRSFAEHCMAVSNCRPAIVKLRNVPTVRDLGPRWSHMQAVFEKPRPNVGRAWLELRKANSCLKPLHESIEFFCIVVLSASQHLYLHPWVMSNSPNRRARPGVEAIPCHALGNTYFCRAVRHGLAMRCVESEGETKRCSAQFQFHSSVLRHIFGHCPMRKEYGGGLVHQAA